MGMLFCRRALIKAAEAAGLAVMTSTLLGPATETVVYPTLFCIRVSCSVSKRTSKRVRPESSLRSVKSNTLRPAFSSTRRSEKISSLRTSHSLPVTGCVAAITTRRVNG